MGAPRLALDVRVARGLGGVREARAVRRLRSRLARLERVLREIAASGDEVSAARAHEALGRRVRCR